MLHYFAKKFFDKVLITSYLDKDRKLSVYVVSDGTMNVRNMTVSISLYKWRSKKSEPFYEIKKPIHVLDGISNHICNIMLDQFLMRCGSSLITAKKNCFLVLKLKDSKNELITSENYVFPTELMYVKGINSPKIKVSITNI